MPGEADLWWWEVNVPVNAELWATGHPYDVGEPSGLRNACAALEEGRLIAVDCQQPLPALCMAGELMAGWVVVQGGKRGFGERDCRYVAATASSHAPATCS